MIINGSGATNTINMTKLAAVFGVIVLIASCSSNDLEQVNKVGGTHSWPVETGVDITINYTDSGKTKALVTAPLLERYTSDDKYYTEMRKGIKVEFLDKA